MQSNQVNRKICFVASTTMTVNAFLQEPIKTLATYNEVYVATNLAVGNSVVLGITNSKNLISIPLERKISLVKDVNALFELICLFRKQQFDIVHSMTPKAGLLAMIASFFARVPVRIHTFTGQVWFTKKGLTRFLLKQLDKVTALFATHVLIDSPTQQDFLLAEGVVDNRKSTVLLKGSVCGVNLDKFKPSPTVRERVREKLEFKQNDVVFLFLGRLARDKGILDLALAFEQLHLINPTSKLLIVGPDEDNLMPEINRIACTSISSIKHIDFTDVPQEYMVAADALCLPSYREGFGGVVVEAAAAGIPAIGSRIYGLIDAIAENESGLLFDAHDVPQLFSCLQQLADDKTLRLNLGQQARRRVEKYFSSDLLAKAWLDFYSTKL